MAYNAAPYRPAAGQIPTDPGVYRFRDGEGRVIYVGKAKNLRSRLSNYFQDPAALHPRTQHMVATAVSVEWTVVATEVEALALEYSWIKQFDPRFNVKYRDDKSYPYLAVTMGEAFPRIQVMRGAKRPGTRYFGPYSHAWAIRETVDLLLRVFPVRTCSGGVFARSKQSGRPCLLGYIERCSAPCVGRIDEADHRALAADFCDFMAGDTARFARRVEAEMRAAAAALDFERAARLRDDAAALAKVVESNAIVLPDGTNADVFGWCQDELEAAVQVFFVRDGRVRGQRGWVVEKVEDIDDAELVERLCLSVYADGAELPDEVLLPVLPPEPEELATLLTAERGKRVKVRVPQRGDKKALAETVARNAEQALALHKTRRSGDLTSRSAALRDLAEALDLAEAPLRIECYDISTTQGTFQVASMVVFEDGLPRKSEYRRFEIKGLGEAGPRDDTAAMHEVITRRFARYLATGDASSQALADPPDLPTADAAPADAVSPEFADAAPLQTAADAAPPHEPADAAPSASDRPSLDGELRLDGEVAAQSPQTSPRKFAYRPSLVVVDGGPPQVAAAAQALRDLGITNVALCGLAKRLEEVWLPGEDFPVILPRTSQGLYLLQRVRDEAHRFAITYHRKRRSAGMTRSALDAVPGLGPARQKALLAHFGSLKALKAADADAIAVVPGFGPVLAGTIYAALHGQPTSGILGQ